MSRRTDGLSIVASAKPIKKRPTDATDGPTKTREECKGRLGAPRAIHYQDEDGAEVSHNIIQPSPSQMNDPAQSNAQSNGGAREGSPGEIHSWSSLKAKKSGCMSDVSMALCIVGPWAGWSHRNKKEALFTQ